MFSVTFSPEADIINARQRYSRPELLVKVSNLVRSARRAQKRQKTLFGKLTNLMTQAHGTSVQLDGLAIEQLLEITQEAAPIPIVRHRRYVLDLEEAEKLLAKAKEAR